LTHVPTELNTKAYAKKDYFNMTIFTNFGQKFAGMMCPVERPTNNK